MDSHAAWSDPSVRRTEFDAVTEQVRERINIREMIESYGIPLKKRGPRYVGLCPLHHERTPSFYANPDQQNYHCFGCGAHGDVFSFVMAMDHVSFPEAKRRLAARVGIPLDDSSPSRETRAVWAREQRALHRDLPAARLWRPVAVTLAQELLMELKAGLYNPQSTMVPHVGEIAEWTRRLARWRAIDGAELVETYRQWRADRPALTDAMVKAAALHETADRRGLDRFWAELDQDRAA